MKKVYVIIIGNKATKGSSVGSPCETLQEAQKMLGYHPLYDVFLEGEMYWPGNRCKGVRLANGEVIMYGEYEREYFTENQMVELRKKAIIDFDVIVKIKDRLLSESAVVCDAPDEIYLSLLEQWGEYHEPAIKLAVETFYDVKIP